MNTQQQEKSTGPIESQPPEADAPPSHEELLHFFDMSLDLLCIAGFDGKFKRLNPIWQSVLGWTREELESRPFMDFVHPDDRRSTLIELEKLSTGATTINFENRYRCKDGSWKWLQWISRPLPELQEIYAIARDVTRQKQLEKQIIGTLEQERERVGRDLHDSLGPHLIAIKYKASLLADELRRRDQPETSQAEKIGEMVDDVTAHARDLVRELFPVQMVEGGLTNALKTLAGKVAKQTGASVSFCETGGSKMAAPEAKLHLYRIAQEALNNACKHGRAENITILLNRSADFLRLAVADDGTGMAPSPAESGGMGLDSMRYRARTLGGHLKIESTPGEGTVVSCEIPYRPPQAELPSA